VWSWRPDAGAKLAMMLCIVAGDGGKRARSPGRARNKLLKPLRREGRMIRHHLWFCRVLPFMHADRGCELAPGLPCALLFLRVFATQASGAFRAARTWHFVPFAPLTGQTNSRDMCI